MGLIGLLMQGQFLIFIQFVVIFIVALTLHEFGHAYAADLQGDRTARLAGRLTLNPLKHLDPIGSLFIVLAGFGWGKPVPFNPHALSNKRFGSAYVALAGPGMNVVLALLGTGVIRALGDPEPFQGPSTTLGFFHFFVYFNLLLVIFNMIPIPPLDGSRVLSAALPPSKQHIIFFLDKWGFLILIVLVFTVLRFFLNPATTWLQNLVYGAFGVS
jgi:Zn-dependent protease